MCRARLNVVRPGGIVVTLPPAVGQPSQRTDPLPPGALVRMDTLRWRAGTVDASALSPDTG